MRCGHGESMHVVTLKTMSVQVLLPAVRVLAEHVRAADLKGGKLLDYVSAQVTVCISSASVPIQPSLTCFWFWCRTSQACRWYSHVLGGCIGTAAKPCTASSMPGEPEPEPGHACCAAQECDRT